MHTVVYWEIPSTDVARTAAFLHELFGWSVEASTLDASHNYVAFEGAGVLGGGIYEVEEPPSTGIRAYVGVEDIPDILARAQSLGGEVTQPKTEIGGDFGYYAELRLPGGCRLGLWSKR